MRFGEFLIKEKKITEEQLKEGLEKQGGLNMKIGEALVHLGYLKEQDLIDYLEKHMILIDDL